MIELVWDSKKTGTVTSASGTTLVVGEDAPFSPEDLLAMAAATCFMRTFVGLAEADAVPILSFVATARVEEAAGTPTIHIRSFVAAPVGRDGRVLDLLTRAARISPVCRMLEGRVTTTPVIQRLCTAEGG